MSPQRVADREIAGAAPSQKGTTNFGERLSAGLASPLGVLLIVPGLVFAVGLFLTLIGQNALRESAATFGRDRLAEQTHSAAQSIASSLSQAHPLLDRMRELARPDRNTHTSRLHSASPLPPRRSNSFTATSDPK